MVKMVSKIRLKLQKIYFVRFPKLSKFSRFVCDIMLSTIRKMKDGYIRRRNRKKKGKHKDIYDDCNSTDIKNYYSSSKNLKNEVVLLDE